MQYSTQRTRCFRLKMNCAKMYIFYAVLTVSVTVGIQVVNYIDNEGSKIFALMAQRI